MAKKLLEIIEDKENGGNKEEGEGERIVSRGGTAREDYKPVNFRLTRHALWERERKGGFCGRVMGQRITKWVCVLCLLSSSVELSLPQMLIICQPFTRHITEGRVSGMEQWGLAPANGPLPHQRRCTNFSGVLIKITRCLHFTKIASFLSRLTRKSRKIRAF